jgi:uncharacterized HAD superfamily protein/GNAT superfamily N-acetyltransferase
MRIGIDIDDTLTDIKDKLTNAAKEYAISLNKNVENKNQQIVDIYTDGNIYQKLFNFSYDELKYFLGTIQEEITNNAVPRKDCADVIKTLHEEGNEIYIITARDSEFHKDPYLQSETWLNKNSIYFDKLIVNARNKGNACLENDIDIFIDDSISNCLNVSSLGIDTITIGNNDNKIVKCFDDWNDIYNYIKNDKIIKIIKYQNEFKNEICAFINESMFTFIDRPYKDRPDVSNIEEYYLKNNGNFWLAIDVKTKKIIGSIALENKDKYGILKRFYVNKEYQKLGIGNRLYKTLYIFVKRETAIEEIVLVSGEVLKEAHHFYIKNGFNQVERLPIQMHYASDDDFFIKKVNREE